jgi:isopenicillin-N N-acyltransferase like protein
VGEVIHRSEEATPRERGEAFGRARAGMVAHTIDVYARLFGDVDPHAVGPDVRALPEEREELAGMAAGAGVDLHALLAVNARTELLAGAAPHSECSVAGGGALLAQNWDWHPDLAASTLVWVVRRPGGWFATLTEAGILAKIGLNSSGLGVCLNLLECSADGGLDGEPIHLLLRRVLASCSSLEEALDLLCGARVAASSAVTVAVPGEVATVELSPGGPNVVRGGFHTNHFLVAPPAGRDTGLEDPLSSSELRLDVVRREPLRDALRSHEGHPIGVCRHVDDSLPWEERTATLASVVMDLAAPSLRVAFGQPCTAAYEDIPLPVAVA